MGNAKQPYTLNSTAQAQILSWRVSYGGRNGPDKQLGMKSKQEEAIDSLLTFIADVHLQRALVPRPKVFEALACQARVCGCTHGGDCSIF